MAVTGQTDIMWANNKRSLVFTIVDSDNGDVALDLTGLTVKWALSRIDSSGAYLTAPVLEKATGGSGIVLTDAPNGICTVTLDAVDTVDLSGIFHFELEVFDGTPEGVVVATGQLTINKNVVNAL